ncbi:MAG: nodulation protein NfeD [Chloroflexi bacterium]|nr:MAG: nodulation protein NfeD [Chloroflexota bacterium]RLC96032.1 MAG: nodulation protein NfeD [Chloroflexota bacterium]
MLKYLRILFLVALFLVSASAVTSSASADGAQVYVLRLDGTVTPPLADYLDRGITKAEDDGAKACVIIMDTPGGLLSSTEEIVNRITNARVPVIVYVDPWAGSAGTFITIAAHVAAMAPGSNIGAASPVSGGGEEISETMQKKVSQHTEAWVESIAEKRGRNKTAAIATVREAASFTDQEALGLDEVEYWEELGLDGPILDPPLVDIGASSLEELLEKVDGWEVTLQSGAAVTLETADAALTYVEMTTIERFLLAISDPDIAYILLSIATLGIMIELFHPGLILPGVTGGVCLFLSIYSLGMLEANYAGILLMVLAFGLFVAEVFTPTFGLLTAGGVVALLLGSFILFSGTPFSVDPRVTAGVVSLFTAIFLFVAGAIVRAHRRRITTGKEGLVGMKAVAKTALDPKGTVLLRGERWNACAEDGTIEPGEEVVVTRVEGLRLWVTRESKRR